MIDFFAELFAIIIMAIIIFGPIALIIYIIKKISKKKSNKKKEQQYQNLTIQPSIYQQQNMSKSTNINQMQNSYQQANIDQQQSKITENKELIDEYYKNQYLPYRPKYFLTKNELYFYNEIQEIAKENNLVVLAKIRLADLVEVEPMDKSKWQTYFNKISKKHVDFALADPKYLKIKLLIEIDDYSHNEQQYERDRFVEAIYNKTGYKLLRIKGTFNLKEKIEGTLKQ